MPNVVNVRFRGHGKAYFFDPNGLEPNVGDAVVVETSKGLELGDCVVGVHEIAEASVVAPLRIANECSLKAPRLLALLASKMWIFCALSLEVPASDAETPFTR